MTDGAASWPSVPAAGLVSVMGRWKAVGRGEPRSALAFLQPRSGEALLGLLSRATGGESLAGKKRPFGQVRGVNSDGSSIFLQASPQIVEALKIFRARG